MIRAMQNIGVGGLLIGLSGMDSENLLPVIAFTAVCLFLMIGGFIAEEKINRIHDYTNRDASRPYFLH